MHLDMTGVDEQAVDSTSDRSRSHQTSSCSEMWETVNFDTVAV